MDLKDRILNATNGGLEVIYYYYPSAREVVDGRAKSFKIRDERTASASIRKYKDMWIVTDFGDDSHGRNCFDICMREENITTFSQALHLLAERYGVSMRLDPEVNKPKFTSRAATEGENNGDWSYVPKKPTDADLKCWGPFVKPETLEKYGYESVESVTTVSKGKVITYTSSDHYPIFIRTVSLPDGSSFAKVYKPYEVDKGWRFRYFGSKPSDYINGLSQIKQRYQELLDERADDEELDEGGAKKKRKPVKLPEIVICSGERDAMNIAGLGYYPIWLNSETADFPESLWIELTRMAENIYNIPDIDATGREQGAKLALRYLELYTVELPQWMLTYPDYRGRPRKDLRDFIELRPKAAEIRDLMRIAKQARFWRQEHTEKGTRLQLNLTSLLYYLRLNGFYKFTNPITKAVQFVRKDRYIIEEYTPQQIRDFVKRDLIERRIDPAIQELFVKSKLTGTTLANDLDNLEVDFSKTTDRSRTFYFANCAAVVTADNTSITRKDEISTKCWSQEIIPHDFKQIEPSFAIEGDLKHQNYTFEIKHIRSHYFRMLINASRMYWREEYEQRIEAVSELNEQYMRDYKFSIMGPRLTSEEIIEQTRHLVNKIYAIGYLLHRYKFASKAYALWVMENRLTDENTSAGGSGKSLFVKTLKSLNLLQIATFQGRDTRLTENKHLLDRINSDTDLINIDDAARNFDFNYFYTMITGDMSVNPKGDKSFEIDYKDAPNFAFTSNFPPPIVGDDTSTARRLLYVVFSDYYHQNMENLYNETRKVADDFGYDLFDAGYTEEMYNEDINFCIDCLRFYLRTLDAGVSRFDPPMENVRKRINIANMGVMFKDWAEVYFSPESGNLDCLLYKNEVFTAFVNETGARNVSSQRFKEKLRAFVANSTYLDELNPRDLRGSDGRILKKMEGKTVECIYLRSYGADLNPHFKNEVSF